MRVASRLLVPVAILLLYLAAGSIALQLVARPENIAYFWPAAGVSAGALIVAAKGNRIAIALAVGVAVILANAFAGRGIAATAVFTIGNVLEAVLCAGLAARLSGGRLQLASIGQVNILIVSSAMASLTAALVTMTGLKMTGESTAPPLDLALTWAMADFAGIMTIAPVFIAFAAGGLPRRGPSFHEGLIALGALAAVTYLGYRQSPVPYTWADLTAFSVTLPFLVWITARAPRQLAAVAPAMVAIIVLSQTVQGRGPYAHPEHPVDAGIMAAQIELVIFAIMALYLSSLFAGYRSALDDLSAGRGELESRFNELEALYAEAPLGLGMLDTNFKFVRINEALAEMNGFSVSQHIGRSVWDLVPGLREEAEPTLQKVLETGTALRDLTLHGVTPAKPGQMREWCEQFYPVKSGDKVVGIGIVCEEVTEKRRAQDRERLLSREVDHRAKNLLAVVHSIVQLSNAEDVEGYRRAISSRIQSLARTHSLLAGSRWEGSGLTKLITEELSPFIRSGRINVEGPDVHLTPSSTQDIALVLHELATNAAKYGALSVPSGTLSVTWRQADQADGTHLHLTWKESGGPPVTRPVRQGFGSALVEATLNGPMKGSAQFHWHVQGLCVELSIPIAETRPRNMGAASSTQSTASHLSLSGRRILLVEDEPLIGLHAQNCLENIGCEVVGPIARMEPAMVAAREAAFDFAIIDINLAGQMTFPVADALVARSIPFAFCSGYSNADDIPDRFSGIAVLRKPLSEEDLLSAVAVDRS
jgi:PAS domain S-box-containing protein